jgi:hypothetical protein
MSNPDYPDFIYRVSIWPGKAGGQSPEVTWVAIPTRYTSATAMTENRRRISLDKLGKAEIIAESNQTTIYRGYVRTKEEIVPLVMAMHEKMRVLLTKKIDQLQRQRECIELEPIIRERIYERD